MRDKAANEVERYQEGIPEYSVGKNSKAQENMFVLEMPRVHLCHHFLRKIPKNIPSEIRSWSSEEKSIINTHLGDVRIIIIIFLILEIEWLSKVGHHEWG